MDVSKLRQAVLSVADAAQSPIAQLQDLQRDAGRRELMRLQDATRSLAGAVGMVYQAAAALKDLQGETQPAATPKATPKGGGS